jgi:hypothetical protein
VSGRGQSLGLNLNEQLFFHLRRFGNGGNPDFGRPVAWNYQGGGL